jgi:hypothetical protein
MIIETRYLLSAISAVARLCLSPKEGSYQPFFCAEKVSGVSICDILHLVEATN